MGDPAPDPIVYIITSAELKAFSGQTAESSDTSFDSIIAGTMATIANYLGYEVEEDELVETYKINEARDYLRVNANILEITSITVDGTTLGSTTYWTKGRNYIEFASSLPAGAVVVVTYQGGLEEDSRDWEAVKAVALQMAACDSMQRNGAADMSSYGVAGGGTTSFVPSADRNPRKYLGRLSGLQAR
jgi:hypothetical protein